MNRLKQVKRVTQKTNSDFAQMKSTVNDAAKVAKETTRVSNVFGNATTVMNSIDHDFESAIKLTKVDTTFLMTATALQVARQYFLSKMDWTVDKGKRKSDQDAAKGTHGKYVRENRGTEDYSTTISEILTNPVPFDTQNGSKLFHENLGGGKYHRLATLGHDPMMGWIFGTANIATRTVTLANLHSYHVTYGSIGVSRKGDRFSSPAETLTVLDKGLIENVYPLKADNLGILGAAIGKEAVHLKSDIFSKQGIALPGVSLLNMDLAKKLCDYGVDMYNVLRVVGKLSLQALLSLGINVLIGMIHRLFYNKERDGSLELFKVRTQKIIAYSNVLAMESNVVASGVMAVTGHAPMAIENLDLGGMLVTVGQLFYDAKFISRVKEEFLKNGWSKAVLGEKLIIPSQFQ
ncbi:hypothetical protein [Levilactobacillus enshiensis]|uniref:hypothetical protein n=1 Tax=Levilactobacillus enshiensis TaxID=2590213 RepID=UPI00117B8305|nr:hypothetical protein [Levilactobacillus enshiensis]